MIRSRKILWALLAAGIGLPTLALAFFSLRQIQEQIKGGAQRQRSLQEGALRERLDRTAADLGRRMEARLERYLKEAASALSDPAGARRELMFEEPWVVHPFRLDGNLALAYPRPPAMAESPVSSSREESEGWTRRLDQAERAEARSPGDPPAVSIYRDCLDRAADPALRRRAAALLGACILRAGDFRDAAVVYDRGWAARRQPLDRESALLGAQRMVCRSELALSGRGDADACVTAEIEWLEAALEADGLGDAWELGPLLERVRARPAPRAASPALLALRRALWKEADRLEDRRRLRRMLDEWGLARIRAAAAARWGLKTIGAVTGAWGKAGDEERVVFAAREGADETQAIALRWDSPRGGEQRGSAAGAGGASGAWLDLGAMEQWLQREAAADPALAGWTVAPVRADSRAAPGQFQAALPARLPLWRLSAPPPGAAGEGAGGSILLGGLLVVSSVAVMLASLALGVWVLRREWALQRMKEQFISSVSHELRTPLALIRTAGETLEMGRARDPERVKGYLSLISRESGRLTRLIDNLLDFSRLDAGRKGHHPEPVALSGFLRSSVEGLKAAYGDGVRWDVAIPGDLPTVQADAESLRAALANLVDNAVKFSPEEKAIAVRAGTEGAEVYFEVEDRGIGIPAAERARVFERFYRGAEAQRRRIPGSGIGLELVRQAAEAHGGRVSVGEGTGASPGAAPLGTRFRVSFPVGDNGGAHGS